MPKHHHDISRRVRVEDDSDITAATVPQLLAMGCKALAGVAEQPGQPTKNFLVGPASA